MRARHEASLSCRCRGTFLTINFHEIDNGGECHGGYDWSFIILERCIGCDEDYDAPAGVRIWLAERS